MGRTYSAGGSVDLGEINSVGDELPLLVIMKPVGDRISVCERNELCWG